MRLTTLWLAVRVMRLATVLGRVGRVVPPLRYVVVGLIKLSTQLVKVHRPAA